MSFLRTMQALVSKARSLFVGGQRGAQAEIQGGQELSPIATFAVMALYGSILIAVGARHEFWRDEVRSLTFAIDNPFPQILFNLRHEGHPVLWLLILKFGWWLFHSERVLPIASAVIAAAATYLFLAKSPFRPWQKVLFAFGVFPLYEYSVMSRNYGISMFLLFAACCLYKDRFVHPLRYGLILVLLANTNVHSLLVAVGFLASLMLEIALQLREHREGTTPLVASAVLVAIAILATFISICPDKTVTYTQVQALSVGDLPKAVLTVLDSPGKILSGRYPGLAYVGICALGLLFYRNKQVFAMLVVATIALSALVGLAYSAELRHKGVYISFIIALFWIDQIGTPIEIRKVSSPVERWKPIVLTVMLVMQVPMAAYRVWRDFNQPLSSAKAFGELVRLDQALKGAIIIGEPDYFMETVPYYLPNDIYVPREERYGRRVEFTTASRQRFTLRELLQTAIRLKNETGRAVLIALGHKLDPNGPFAIDFGFRRVFEYSPQSVEEFLARTAKLADFQKATGDENYAVYLVTD